MLALVTGASGLVGTALCSRLVESGHPVVGLIHNSSNETIERLKSNHYFVTEKADVRSLDSMFRLFDTHGFDVVFHLAASLPYDPSPDFVGVNVAGSDNVSAAAYGCGTKVYLDEAAPSGRCPYQALRKPPQENAGNRPGRVGGFPYCTPMALIATARR